MILFFTIIAVSIDAYIASLAYSMTKKLNFFQVLYSAAYTFVFCTLSLLLASYLNSIGSLIIKILGGVIFICLGIKNIIGFIKNKKIEAKTKTSIWGLTVLGIAVATDASLACLSIAAIGWQIPLFAFYMFLAHFLFLLLGMLTVKWLKVFSWISLLSGCFLIGLGIYKLIM